MSRPVVKAEGYDYIVKVIIIGDSNVGKTSIMKAFLNKEIPQTYLPTLGVDFSIKTINVDDKKVKMQIWDTAGQDRFKTITASYYRGAVGVLVVYAINDKASSKHVENWVKQIEEKCEAKIAKFLVGNKSDTERQVDSSEGQHMAKKYNMNFMETSAKENSNITQLFQQLGKEIKDKYLNKVDDSDDKPQNIIIDSDSQGQLLRG